MNALYHIAIIEGFLGQHAQLPRNVQDAIDFLKQGAITNPAEKLPRVKKRKKWKPTPEERQKQLAQLARMREKAKANREARKAA